MNPRVPVFVVRALPRLEAVDGFFRWLRSIHLRDVRRIPGIAKVRWGQTAGGAILAVYTFTSPEAVRGALESPQAAYARGTWERWVPDLEEFVVDLYAPVEVSPAEVPRN